MVRKSITSFFDEFRAKRIANYLNKYLAPGETVIDCGCGSLRIAQILQQLTGVKVYGADMIDLNQTKLNFCICSGENLAFATRCVSVVCLIFVLHHIENPIEALKECLRVANLRVIILEDVFQNSVEKKLTALLDWIGNRSISSDMNMPFNFRSEKEWKDIFAALNVRLVAVECIRPVPWRLSRHRLFILDKKYENRN